jgi:exodeoxyribonuclease-3
MVSAPPPARAFSTGWRASQADIVCVQELKAQLADLTPALSRPDGFTGCFHCAEKKGYSGVGIYSRRSRTASSKASATPSSMPKGATCRPTSASFGGFALPALRLQFRRAPAGQVPLSRPVPAPQLEQLAEEAGATGAKSCCAATGTSPTSRNRPEELEIEPEELRLPARGARLADIGLRRSGLGGRASRCCRRPPARPTPGGRTAARPGPRTSAGASTTRSPRRAWRRRRAQVSVYKEQRFSDHAPLTVDYDFAVA